MALELLFKVIGSDELVSGVCKLMHDKDKTTVESGAEDDMPENETVEKPTTADKELSNIITYNFLTTDVAFFWVPIIIAWAIRGKSTCARLLQRLLSLLPF